MNWSQWVSGELDRRRRDARWRECVTFENRGPEISLDGREVISFASNDYLGLSVHPRVRAAAIQAIERWGSGAGASRLVTGTRPIHKDLEAALADYKQGESALVFSSGYAANVAVTSVLGSADVTIFSDALNHASIIDGCRLARGKTVIYRHADVEHLTSLMRDVPGRKLIVTESIFSMDGDAAPLAEISELARAHDALLVVDEAHAVFDSPPTVDGGHLLRIGTLSKMFGSLGGWVCGPRTLIELLVNCARSFIYSTALTPADTAAALVAVEICGAPEGETRRTRLRHIVDRLRPGHPSAIVPIVLGDESAALSAAERMLQYGLHTPAIRPPTVPSGTSRLRLSLTALHDGSAIDRLVDAMRKEGITS